MLCGWGCGGWLTSHVMRAHFYKMPEPAGSRTSGEQPGPTTEKLESQAWTPARPPNALRLALWLQTHGERHAVAFR
jgi:hypothetical protein